jgi:hypothetical protein
LTNSERTTINSYVLNGIVGEPAATHLKSNSSSREKIFLSKANIQKGVDFNSDNEEDEQKERFHTGCPAVCPLYTRFDCPVIHILKQEVASVTTVNSHGGASLLDEYGR